MTLLLVQALNGLQFGVLLFLIAAGLTLVFGVMDVINLAHGVQYMMGAYLAVLFARWTGSFWLALPLAAAASFAAGLLLDAAVFRHLRGRDHLDQVLATYGLILALEEGARALFGPAPLSLALPDALSGTVALPGGLNYPAYRLALLAAGLAVAGLLWAARGRPAQTVVAAAAWTALLVHSYADHLLEFAPVVLSAGMVIGWAATTRASVLPEARPVTPLTGPAAVHR